ncbi:MAG: ABC-F family ATP-binding cassette domain-containing protein [Deltaproteobacteria bacterium]|nr:MAG: ABC-F family ATP-binding cassette domain-containing protein [Deltaproteobacteria bacterium]
MTIDRPLTADGSTAMISFSRISKSFAKHDVLIDCSFQVNPGEHVGIIGANGSGKSTVFRLLTGLEYPDEGQMSMPKHLRVGHLPQDVLQFHGKTVLAQVMDVAAEVKATEAELSLLSEQLEGSLSESEVAEAAQRQSRLLEEYQRLGGYQLEANTRKVLAGLGFSETDMERPVEEMSGGWAMRVALARILLSEPDLILLDEPTNHLDLDSLVWLEEYLAQSPATLMLISHDRVFLDRVVQRFLELENGRITSYPGTFQRYLEDKEKQLEQQWAAFRHQQEEIRQIKRFIDRNRARKDRARQVQARLKTLGKMELISPPTAPARFSFNFPPPTRAPKVVLELKQVCKSYGPLPIYDRIAVTIQRGDRVALIGANGAGKTTLLKLLAGVLNPDLGQRIIGSGTRIAYFAQQQLELLDPRQTVLESLASVAGDMGQGKLRNLLGGFLFQDDEAEKRISVLSGGERSRLLLCQILAQQANLLLLDEPTNHLDIPGRRVLEEALKAYAGTICLVSHDRHLINAIANKILVINNRRVEMFHGNYSDYQDIWRKQLDDLKSGAEEERCWKQTTSISKRSKEQKRLEAEWRNELYRRKEPLKQRLESLEQTIEEITGRIDTLNSLLARPETYENGSSVTELTLEYQKLKRSLEDHNQQWEQTAAEMEALEESFWQDKALGR